MSPDGSQRLLIANKVNAPLDNNTSLVLKGDVLCTANLGFTHAKPEEADRTVVCMKGFPEKSVKTPLMFLRRFRKVMT